MIKVLLLHTVITGESLTPFSTSCLNWLILSFHGFVKDGMGNDKTMRSAFLLASWRRVLYWDATYSGDWLFRLLTPVWIMIVSDLCNLSTASRACSIVGAYMRELLLPALADSLVTFISLHVEWLESCIRWIPPGLDRLILTSTVLRDMKMEACPHEKLLESWPHHQWKTLLQMFIRLGTSKILAGLMARCQCHSKKISSL